MLTKKIKISLEGSKSHWSHKKLKSIIIPKHSLNKEEISPRIAYELIHDEMFFDANPRLNMASFVTTWMEPEAGKLMMEAIDKNLIDKPIYPQTLEVQQRCVSILANLFNAPEDATGTATTGSSEAIHLAGLVMKWNWKKWHKDKFKKEPPGLPNIIMGSNVQVCWKKFTRYFEVEEIQVPTTPDNKLDIDKAVDAINDFTIGVVGLLGNTYSGEFDDIKKLNKLISASNKKYGREVPIHVDAASGGGIAPFTKDHSKIVWDFKLDWVKSINVSGHKYGLVYPGVGWAIWPSEKLIPEELIFEINYLGDAQQDFGLNFSRGAAQIFGQYYNFVRYGEKGYKKIMNVLMEKYHTLKPEILKIRTDDISKVFKLVSHDKGLPLICVTLTNDALEKGLRLETISHKAKERGWILPVYPLSDPYEDVIVMRMVLKRGFTLDMGYKLINDIQWAVNEAPIEFRSSNLSHGHH